MTTTFRADLSGLITHLLDDAEITATDLHRRLTDSGLHLSRLAFDGLLVKLEVQGAVYGRYPTNVDDEAPALRIYRRCSDTTPDSARQRSAA